VDRAVYIFLGLVLIWVVLKVIAYFMRRAYNLTPVGTAKSKNVKPDFLKVDHAQRDQIIDRGRQFDKAQEPPVETAARATKWGVVISAVASFAAAVFFALSRVPDYEEMWGRFSTWNKFLAIVLSHPVGFTIAVIMIIPGLFQLLSTLRQRT
jgi:hypothetical protein